MTYYKIKKYEVEVETLEMVKEAIHAKQILLCWIIYRMRLWQKL